MEYVRFSKGVSKYTLEPYDENLARHIDRESDWYCSIFFYSEEQYQRYKKTGTIAGIKDVTTDRLVWDFDSKDDIEAARLDALELCNRLVARGFPETAIETAFSGSKGYSVELIVDTRLTPDEFKNINLSLAEGLKTNDTQILDPARIFRVPGTKHPKSGLFKLPISVATLRDTKSDAIKELAKDLKNATWPSGEVVPLPQEIHDAAKPKTPKLQLVEALPDIDFKLKPKGFSNCKYAILNGYFPAGTRNNALKALAATCRSQGYPKEVAYRMLKGAAELQSKRFGSEPFSKEEIWNTCIETTYGPSHQGGTYSCRNQPWLKQICDGLGTNRCKHDTESPVVTCDEVFGLFKDYAVNYDKNVLTTGIGPLDRKAKLMVGTSVGVLAPPGVGKTSLSLSILNHNSKQNVNSIFFSYDMFHSMVYLRLVQKHFGLQQEQIFDLVKKDPKKVAEIKALLAKEYKKVNFCFKSGQTADEIDETIVETQDRTGEKVKLVIIDYNELVATSISDPTQASAQVAQRLRQIANDREVCVVTLLQPSKVFSNPADEITTYQGAKGSGAIAQSLSLMLSLSRPGFSPRNPETDRFFTINALKHRQGALFTLDLGWDGLTGSIHEIGPDELDELAQLRSRREAEKKNEESW